MAPSVEEHTPYDITSRISPYLDVEMLLHVLDWLADKETSSDELADVRADVAKKVESQKLTDEKFKEVEAELLMKIEPLKEALGIYKKSQVNRISSSAERIWLVSLPQWLASQENVTLEIDSEAEQAVFMLAKLYSNQGDWSKCKQWLVYYLENVAKYTYDGNTPANRAKCYWGILRSITVGVLLPSTEAELIAMASTPLPNDENREVSILEPDLPRTAVQCIVRLAELLGNEEIGKTRKEMVLKRVWLLHWAMFYVFKYHIPLSQVKTKGAKSYEWPHVQEYLIDDRNMAVVQIVAPHLLRYYAVYAILHRNRKDHFKVISAAISNGKSKYSDTFTALVGALFVDFNFEDAQKHIARIQDACRLDVFLDPLKFQIEEHSRHIIFETYCRIHKSINLDLIAQKVNMSALEAERWIVGLIRHSHLEAKIDSEKNCVEISTVPPNLYQQVIEKTQNLTLRSNIILQNLINADSSGPVYTRSQDDKGAKRSGQQQRRQQNTRFQNFSQRDFFRSAEVEQ
ncbi:putative eukaryotic translation initiation factor 3 subunit 6 [Babesia bovis T2Bo]|uniref:Eukaryotic translation initiation factor 3 subunit E n=1 Tax=Babesia bovis TaxID=5865 RepID=A7ANK5_BABBO|nr:putative eukaryotic translation initiation factor 3 subunit 6 [Babesia bovis T2Bo]EDO08139.1 putative eukaryotic translation initiation factor 3 subunit 6 [Babesia bovis T2Bo]|eukprot:XP_001611707.1 eukaryotic translation initiation factor 3, subunit 6 [Babesia bovis T2Bo]